MHSSFTMVAISVIFATLCAAAHAMQFTPLQQRDNYCGDNQGVVLTSTGYHCCPGSIVHQDGKVMCCVGGKCTGKVTGCKEDPSDCKSTFDVDDPNYKQNVKDKTGITVNTANGPGTDGSDSGSGPSASGAGFVMVGAAIVAAIRGLLR